MHSYYDAVVAISLMAAVGIVFGFLGGVVADSQALAAPMAAIALLLTGATFALSGRHNHPPTIAFNCQTKILKGYTLR
jgi:formyltetrahydrofolate synthetase